MREKTAKDLEALNNVLNRLRQISESQSNDDGMILVTAQRPLMDRLARDLKTSRIQIERLFEHLVTEGYVQSDGYVLDGKHKKLRYFVRIREGGDVTEEVARRYVGAG